MKTLLKLLAMCVVVTSMCVVTVGCGEKGDAEKAGKKVDEAVKDGADAVKDATE